MVGWTVVEGGERVKTNPREGEWRRRETKKGKCGGKQENVSVKKEKRKKKKEYHFLHSCIL